MKRKFPLLKAFKNYSKILPGSLVAILMLLLCTACEKKKVSFAELIIQGGHIYTVNEKKPKVEAVAVKDGLIIFAGDSAEVDKLRGPDTYTLNLNGKTAIPGFIDGHAHFLELGFNKSRLDLSRTQNFQDIIDSVKSKVATTEKGKWISGRGWHQSKWKSNQKGWVKGFPTHKEISAISPDNPVILEHASGHTLLVNKAAMDLAGIGKNTKSPAGGEIIRDAKGNPTGLFVENAQGLIDSLISEPTDEERRQFVKVAFQEILTNGITSFQDAGMSPDDIELMKNVHDEVGLPARLWVMLSYKENLNLDSIFQKGPLIVGDKDLLTIGGLKVYADGALGSRGAWLKEEYTDQPGHFGHELVPMKIVHDMAVKALKLKFQLCVHAIGDKANHEVLNNIQKAMTRLPEMYDHRFRIEHAQHLLAEDIPRFSQLGVLPSMQGIHMSSDMPWAINRLGPKRISEGAYVWRKLLDAGSRIISGTDAPVEPVNPLKCFYSLVTRKTLEGTSKDWFHPEQKMTRAEALKSYTLDAAYGVFQDKDKGSLEKGKMADITILSKDIMTIPAQEILNTLVTQTIVGGVIQYQRE